MVSTAMVIDLKVREYLTSAKPLHHVCGVFLVEFSIFY